MINLKDELPKFKPMLELDDVEKAVSSNELQDILDMLQYSIRPKKNVEKE